MKKILGQLSLVSLLVIPPMGCGNAVDEAAKQATRRTALKVESLDSLMKEHPPLARASLAQIKQAASGFQALAHTRNLPTIQAPRLALARMTFPNTEQPTTAINEELPLEQPVAEEAQDLIDDILDSFDMGVQLRAGIKVAGIAFNEQKAMYEELKESGLFDEFESSKGVFEHSGSKFGNDESSKNPFEEETCEQIVDGPITKIIQGRFDRLIKKSQNAIKNSLSGCSKIRGAEFVSCIKYANETADIIIEYGTCSMTSMEDLEEILMEKMEVSPKEYKKLKTKCQREFFASCGFEQEQPDFARE